MMVKIDQGLMIYVYWIDALTLAVKIDLFLQPLAVKI